MITPKTRLVRIRARRLRSWQRQAGTRGASPEVSQAGKPSVAVMPFANLAQTPDYEYFAYGLTEDVIRALGRNRWLRVLTRHATVGYRGQDVETSSIGAALGVRYVVQGSVRKIGDMVRIAAELVDADDNTQLWCEVYDLPLPEIFEIQDAMAKQIAAVIEPELASVEQEIASRKPPASLDAWDCYQRGLWHLWGFTSPGFDEAEAMFRRSIELEPGLARAHAGLSYVQLQKAFYVGPTERTVLLLGGMAAARAAVALDARDSLCRCVLGRAYCLQQQYDAAIAELEATIAMNPSFAQGCFALAFTLVWCRREDEAISLLETACDLSPRDPHLWTFHHCRAVAHFSLGELKSAEFFARKAHRHPNATSWASATLAATLGHLGRSDDAAGVVAELLQRRPGYTRSAVRDDLFFCADESFIERYLDGLALAGLPA